MKSPVRRISASILILFTIAATTAMAQDRAARIDELMKKYHEYGQFNGSVLVAENGRVIYKKGLGWANMEWKVPNEPDTKFRIASITKQFTAAAILQLVDQRKIKLDGKITDYLPDYRKDTGDRVTIHHLLNHTSGIPSYTSQPGFFANESRNPYKVADFVKKFSSGDLEFEPGTKFVYNNSAYYLLGAIIEKVTGKTYEQAMQENVFGPAGMTNSGYDTSARVIEKRAAGYRKTPNGFVNAPYLDMSLPYAAGSLYSTAEDLYLWDQALNGDKILSAKSKELMFRPTLENYGYGVESVGMMLSDKTTSVPVVRHDGGINGFSTNIVRFVSDKHLIVLLDNTSQGNHQGRMIAAIANILYDKPYETAKRSIAETVRAVIEDQGLEQAIKKYRELKATRAAEYDFSEGELNGLGYQLLRAQKPKEAGEIFKLNIEMFPEVSRPYESLGEYYARSGQKEIAIKNYKRALVLNPKNTSAAIALKKLEAPAASVDPKILAAYAGRYELAPNFILTVTTENGKLHAQATGQSKVELAAISETKFRYTVVDAEISFIKGADGTVTGLNLFQGGSNMPAKKLP